ncbi:hypothetical protein ACFOM8_01980 [Paracoccus angustae]|uniref:Uncharacterized protein n=1 Tax=Paracoccus angustae TaxID=1671480 RepID=A0ABV7TZJ9_9RHOB
MDKQAKSTFIGIMAAVAAIVVIGGGGYGIYYASQADERRSERLDRSMRDLRDSVNDYRCATERVRLFDQGKDFGLGHPCRD